MTNSDLDPVDKGILYLLQENARSNTTTDIADKVDVSSSTVGNRINALEANDVIRGYYPSIDYEKAGIAHYLHLTGTVDITDEETTVENILNVFGVVSVKELLSNNQNVIIEVVGHSRAEIEDSIRELNAEGVEIDRVELIKQHQNQPYDHFGQQYTNDENGG